MFKMTWFVHGLTDGRTDIFSGMVGLDALDWFGLGLGFGWFMFVARNE